MEEHNFPAELLRPLAWWFRRRWLAREIWKYKEHLKSQIYIFSVPPMPGVETSRSSSRCRKPSLNCSSRLGRPERYSPGSARHNVLMPSIGSPTHWAIEPGTSHSRQDFITLESYGVYYWPDRTRSGTLLPHPLPSRCTSSPRVFSPCSG